MRLVALILILAVPTVFSCGPPKNKLEIPDQNWVPQIFERTGIASKPINQRAAESNLPLLKTVVLPNSDLEIRVWVGFGITGVDGLVLRRSADQWSAIHLHGMARREPFPNSQENLGSPKSGWQQLWKQLSDAGVLTLVDSFSIECNPGVLDGKSYVVETNTNRTYRTYAYPNPRYAKCEQAKQMVKIGEIISTEFGLDEFSSYGRF